MVIVGTLGLVEQWSRWKCSRKWMDLPIITGTFYSYCTAATGGTGATQFAAGVGGIHLVMLNQGVSSLCYGADGAALEGRSNRRCLIM